MTKQNCEHEIIRNAIGGFPGHEHIHPGGEQFCFNCKKTLNQIIKETRDEAEFELQNIQKMTAYSEGQNKENQAWLRGERCHSCGKPKDNTGLSDICFNCLEMDWHGVLV